MRNCRLLIFTRYPVAGKTKTRLIPVLGPEGAARLQQRLTEKLIGEARLLEEKYGTQTTVLYQGGSRHEVTAWLGRIICREQATGDLGRKMRRALEEAFLEGAERAVLVGTDIPDLSVDILAEAFTALTARDVVLGPSRDGGYYLVGLAASAAPDLLGPLFDDMVWSNGEVLALTLRRLAEAGRTAALLPALADIDRPEDLALAKDRGLL